MTNARLRHTAGADRGFTLIEIVITIVILGAVAGILVPFLNAIVHSPDPVIRERAISLGQAMMDEIMAKRWDENSPVGGGPVITGESPAPTGTTCTPDPYSCTGNRLYCFICRNPGYIPADITSGSLGQDAGEDSTDRREWDDVDDYNVLNEPVTGNFHDQNNNSFTLPAGYTRTVSVCYIASNSNPIDQTPATCSTTTTDTKRVVVTITSPLGEKFYFVAVACNI